MKLLITAFYIIAFIFILSSSAKAQDNDYIITNKGDTLKGQLNGRRFKAKGWAKAKRIDLDNIKETYVADDNILKRAVYVSNENTLKIESYNPIAGQRIFMTVLENGKISLYENIQSELNAYKPLNSPTSLTPSMVYKGYWYVAKRSDTVQKIAELNLIQIKSKKRMDMLAQLLIDNKEVHDKFIADDKVSLKQIRNIIHLYNTGKPYQPKPPKEEKVDTSNDFSPGQ